MALALQLIPTLLGAGRATVKIGGSACRTTSCPCSSSASVPLSGCAVLLCKVRTLIQEVSQVPLRYIYAVPHASLPLHCTKGKTVKVKHMALLNLFIFQTHIKTHEEQTNHKKQVQRLKLFCSSRKPRNAQCRDFKSIVFI